LDAQIEPLRAELIGFARRLRGSITLHPAADQRRLMIASG
jgi:hypothetical protein